MVTLGGLSDVHVAQEDIQEMVDEMRPFAEAKANKTFDMFKAISYRTQVVAGINYFVKVQVSESSFVELRIYKSLQSSLELTNMMEGLSENSEITYFE